VSSREQYRWMERFIPMVDEPELRGKLTQAIDGKGAFRRFKDVLMTFGAERERWFTFRSERLRTFMEAWLSAHAIRATPRPAWADATGPDSGDVAPDSLISSPEIEAPKSSAGKRVRNAEATREHLRELIETLGPRDLDVLVSFAEFLKARRAARGFAHHHEHLQAERAEGALSQRGTKLAEAAAKDEGDSK
jgi:hypothetical protein